MDVIKRDRLERLILIQRVSISHQPALDKLTNIRDNKWITASIVLNR